MDNMQTCDHCVDASTNTIKYLNGLHVGWIVIGFLPTTKVEIKTHKYLQENKVVVV